MWLLILEPSTPSREKLSVVLITIFAHSSTRLFTFHFFTCFTFELWYFLIYFEYNLPFWYSVCNFSVGYLFILLTVEETMLSLFSCLRNLVNFIWPFIHEFTWGSLFLSLGLCMRSYVTIIQLWSLYLCNVFWNQEVRKFEISSPDYCGCLESLGVPYIFLDFFFPFLAKWNWKCLPLSSLRVWET